jgi:hypothetical protein
MRLVSFLTTIVGGVLAVGIIVFAMYGFIPVFHAVVGLLAVTIAFLISAYIEI